MEPEPRSNTLREAGIFEKRGESKSQLTHSSSLSMASCVPRSLNQSWSQTLMRCDCKLYCKHAIITWTGLSHKEKSCAQWEGWTGDRPIHREEAFKMKPAPKGLMSAQTTVPDQINKHCKTLAVFKPHIKMPAQRTLN